MNKLIIFGAVLVVCLCAASASQEDRRGRRVERRREREERQQNWRDRRTERREDRDERRESRTERREGREERREELGDRAAERFRGRRMGPRLLCNIEGDAEIPERRRPTGDCPDESTCSIGPISVEHRGKQASLTFCDAQDNQGNLLIFRGACRIELDDGTVIDRTRGRCHFDDDGDEVEEEEEEVGGDCCTRGPLTGFNYMGQAAEAYFPRRMIPRRGRRPHFGNDREDLDEVAQQIDSDDSD